MFCSHFGIVTGTFFLYRITHIINNVPLRTAETTHVDSVPVNMAWQ